MPVSTPIRIRNDSSPIRIRDVAAAVTDIGLEYVVLTSVDRDDLPDQGAKHVAETIREIKDQNEDVLVEALIPDFQGDDRLIETVIDAEPDVLAHNVETVERLQRPVRDRRAGYEQSLAVLDRLSRSDCYAKTSLMLGVGEYAHEVYQTLADLREIGVDIVVNIRRKITQNPSTEDMSNGRLARPVAYLFNQTSGHFAPSEQAGCKP